MAEKKTRRTKQQTEAPASTPDLTSLTPEQAAEMIRALQEQLAEAAATPAPEPETASPEQQAQIRQLQAALLDSRKKEQAAKRLAKQANDEEVFEVKSLIGAAVSVEITDAKGNLKRVVFEQKGAVHFLTAGQIAEVQDRTDFFERGYLQAPEAVPVNPNTVENYDAFIASLDAESIRDRIAEMDSPETLFSLYHHVEGKRFVEEGNEVRQVEITGKEQIVLYTVMERLRSLTGINLSSTDTE